MRKQRVCAVVVKIDNFLDTLTYSGLFDLSFVGPNWKWQQEVDDYIRARLDRGLTSINFSQLFLSCSVHNTLLVTLTILH